MPDLGTDRVPQRDRRSTRCGRAVLQPPLAGQLVHRGPSLCSLAKEALVGYPWCQQAQLATYWLSQEGTVGTI